VEPLSFADAIAAEPDRLAGERDRMVADPHYFSRNYKHYSYLARGHYADSLERWFDVVPRERFRSCAPRTCSPIRHDDAAGASVPGAALATATRTPPERRIVELDRPRGRRAPARGLP
jgi:hypothetical protein